MDPMSSNTSPAGAGEPNPYSREAAPGQGLGEPPELAPEEVAAATRWAASLNPDQEYGAGHPADPYAAYAGPHEQAPWDPYAATPYGTVSNSNPYGVAHPAPYDAYSPYAGQHPEANPYSSVNPYVVTPANSYGLYGPYQQPLTNHPMAVPSLVLSLISYIFCPLLGVVGLIMGINALNGVNARPETYSGKGIAIAGIVLGGIATLVTLFFLFFLVFGFAAF